MRFIQGFSTKIKAELGFRKTLLSEKKKYDLGSIKETLPNYNPYYNLEIKIFNDQLKDLRFRYVRAYAEWRGRLFYLGEKRSVSVEGRSVSNVSLSVSNHPLFTIFLYFDWDKHKEEKAIGKNNYYYQRFPHDVIIRIVLERKDGKEFVERIRLYK